MSRVWPHWTPGIEIATASRNTRAWILLKILKASYQDALQTLHKGPMNPCQNICTQALHRGPLKLRRQYQAQRRSLNEPALLVGASPRTLVPPCWLAQRQRLPKGFLTFGIGFSKESVRFKFGTQVYKQQHILGASRTAQS